MRRTWVVLAVATTLATLMTVAPPAGAQAVLCGGVEATIVGTSGPDVLTGTPGKDVIHGLGGNDTIRGLDGRDTLCGGEGRDRIFGGRGPDTIFGGGNGDKIKGGTGADTLVGDAGNDLLVGGYGEDQLIGGRGRVDRLSGRAGIDACNDSQDETRRDSCEVRPQPVPGPTSVTVSRTGSVPGSDCWCSETDDWWAEIYVTGEHVLQGRIEVFFVDEQSRVVWTETHPAFVDLYPGVNYVTDTVDVENREYDSVEAYVSLYRARPLEDTGFVAYGQESVVHNSSDSSSILFEATWTGSAELRAPGRALVWRNDEVIGVARWRFPGSTGSSEYVVPSGRTVLIKADWFGPWTENNSGRWTRPNNEGVAYDTITLFIEHSAWGEY